MSRNDAEDFAQRMYARLPANYRVYDVDRGQPLLALMRVIGAQAANLRADLDALWDNFFIETCDDWVVPYIGALLGVNLLQTPVGQSNRLDVWNTVQWRRTKGTPEMLQELASAISGWSVDPVAEFFQQLGWSQNMNHVRLDRALTPDLRDPYALSLLGHATDPLAHAADFKPACALDEARVTPAAGEVGRAAWGTPGRYQIRNLGFFARRLTAFPAVRGATPALAAPGTVAAAGASCWTFNSLFRETPLFSEDSGAPITRAGFAENPWASFGEESDIAVRQFGVLLATESAPAVPAAESSQNPYTFAGAVSGIGLDARNGLRLMSPRALQPGSGHFLITAVWRQGAASTPLGVLSTLFAASGTGPSYQALGTASGAGGQLTITVQTGGPGEGWTLAPLPASPAARFPGAVVALRAARPAGPLHSTDGLYVYLPAGFLLPGQRQTYFIADDGSAYTSPSLDPSTLARPSEGDVYPARSSTGSTESVEAFLLNRGARGLILPDPTRFGNASVLIAASLMTGPNTFQTLGAIATTAVSNPASQYPGLGLQAPTPWPAFTYAPSRAALQGQVPAEGILAITMTPAGGNFAPLSEIVITNQSGQVLLAYLPEVPAGSPPINLLVASDGSTYYAPAAGGSMPTQGLVGLTPARPARGQVLPIAGVWPLRQRTPVAINLCRNERTALLGQGELGIDPELGRFALPPQDPALSQGGFTVDFVEAFGYGIGALNFDNQAENASPATRVVSQSGDSPDPLAADLQGAPVHTSLADAIAAAENMDVIEIADSATYASPSGIALANAAVKTLTIRAAAGQRPTLTFYAASGQPSAAGITLLQPMALSLNGLLISGGPIVARSAVTFSAVACTFDPRAAGTASLISTDANTRSNAKWCLRQCIAGAILVSPGVGQLTICDSIVEHRNAWAIAGAAILSGSPPVLQGSPGSAPSVQLERVTIIGQIACDVLTASDSLLNDLAFVADRQSGCVRFTRFEPGSILPRRYHCIPTDAQSQACASGGRCLAPLFRSLVYGRPDYAQLAAGCPRALLTASESGAEVGAFAARQNTIRLNNLRIKLREFMPVGLNAVVIAET